VESTLFLIIDALAVESTALILRDATIVLPKVPVVEPLISSPTDKALILLLALMDTLRVFNGSLSEDMMNVMAYKRSG